VPGAPRNAAVQRPTPVSHRAYPADSGQGCTGSRGDVRRWSIADIPVFPPASTAGKSAVGNPLVPLRSSPAAGPNLTLGEVHDPAEHQAEHLAQQVMNASRAASVLPVPTATAAGQAMPLAKSAGTTRQAPGIVHETLRTTGQPLDSVTRSFLEPRFGVDLSGVRVHADTLAARSARSVGARAYTLGDHIVLGAGQYRPGTAEGRALLAHELAHVTTSRSAVVVRRQPAAPPAPGKDYVFIMGADASPKNPFFKNAERYYRAHLPNAVFNTSQRSLEGLLNFLATRVHTPIANLYIVSHGSEDGTLSFSLEPNAKPNEGRLTVQQLRAALHPLTGTSRLASVTDAVDENTRIHIKGCNIGRTQEMVELLSEAFGGAGTVTAPTHEQDFTPDLTLREQAKRREHDTRIAEFSKTLPAVPDMPGPVDPELRGAERKTAQQKRTEEVKQRQAVITARAQALRAEEKRIAPEVAAAAARAEWVESLSGPMFQRPGTQQFTADQLRPQVDRLYRHLGKDQREKLVQRLVKPDQRSPARVQALQQAGYPLRELEGQYVQRISIRVWRFPDPQDLKEARHLFQKQLTQNHFTPSDFNVTKADGKTDIKFTGRTSPPGKAAFDDTLSFNGNDGELDEKEVIARGRQSPQTQNPDRYTWHVERTHEKDGWTIQTAVAERVVAYLSHGKLDVSPHEPFTKPETDPDFYATSKTFEPTKI
jgi:hypothetical protein